MKTFFKIFLSGLCGVVVGVFIFGFIFLFPNFFYNGKEIIGLFFPLLFVASLGLGMRGTPASTSEVITTLIFAISLTVILYFIAGVVVSQFYRKVIKPRGRKTIIVFFIFVVIFIAGLLFYESRVSYIGATISSCQGLNISRLKKDFNIQSCLYEVARTTKDPVACDQIPQNNYRRRDCVIGVAREKMDYKICDLLSNKYEKNNCLFGIAMVKGECSVLDSSSANYCYLYGSQSILTSARDNRCDIFRTDQQVQCEKFKNGNITIQDLCKNITDIKIKNQCLSQSIDGIQVKYR